MPPIVLDVNCFTTLTKQCRNVKGPQLGTVQAGLLRLHKKQVVRTMIQSSGESRKLSDQSSAYIPHANTGDLVTGGDKWNRPQV